MKPRQNIWLPGSPHPQYATHNGLRGSTALKYLGSTVTHNNDISGEITIRLMAANRAYFALIKLLKSRLLSRKTKMQFYKTVIRPGLTYASETWTSTKNDTRMMEGFEREVLRRKVGPVNENGRWRRRYKELYSVYKEPMVTDIVRSARLRWTGHAVTMSHQNKCKTKTSTAQMDRWSGGGGKRAWATKLEDSGTG
jgi:hypothetical protein